VNRAERVTTHRKKEQGLGDDGIDLDQGGKKQKNHIIADAINQSYWNGEVKRGGPSDGDGGGHSA